MIDDRGFLLLLLPQRQRRLQPPALKDRNRDRRAERIEQRVEREQIPRLQCLDASAAAQRERRIKIRVGHADRCGRGVQLRLGLADVRPLRDQFRRQARRDARDSNAAHAAAADHDALGRPRQQQREHRFALPQRLHERRDRRALGVHQAFLLRHVEVGRGAGGELLLDQIENAGRAGHVFTRDAQAVLRR